MTKPVRRNDPVAYLHPLAGVVEGTIVEGPAWHWPNSTVTKYGGGTMGQAVWGYKVRGPIVQADGSFYRVRGEIAPGIGFVPAADLIEASY